MRFPKKWPLRVALAAVGLVVVAVPIAWANDVFPDVPTANPHHNSINAIANAGVTSGCGGGFYCPANNVRRDEMATFLRQSSGRGVRAKVSDAVTTTEAVLATVTLTVPGNGLVLVTGAAEYNPPAACNFRQRIIRPTSGDASWYQFTGVSSDPVSTSNTLLSPVLDGPGTRIFNLQAEIWSGTCTSVTAFADLDAIWVPFGATGFAASPAPAPPATGSPNQTPGAQQPPSTPEK